MAIDIIDQDQRIPVTILSGVLGSGKTTLLQHILKSKEHQRKVAVIVNDMAELNIDAEVVQTDNFAPNTDNLAPSANMNAPQPPLSTTNTDQVVHVKREIVALSNGCICCTLRGDLIRETNRIQELGAFDYILIESTGIAEPQQVAESFCADPATLQLATDPAQQLWNVARLDTCVTVIDASDFPRQLASLKRFKDEFKDGLDDDAVDDAEGSKNIAHLLIEQVEFANVIVLNKTDLVSTSECEAVIKSIKALNPIANIVLSEYAAIDLNNILDTKTFSMAEAEKSPGWQQSFLNKDVTSELDEYNISSFVYRARKPFHSQRLAAWVNAIMHFAEDWRDRGGVYGSEDDVTKMEVMRREFGHIIRSKGFCWIAGNDLYLGGWSHSGRLLVLHPMAMWWADKPESEWNVPPDKIEVIRKSFVEPYGDRRQEIVFIGTELKSSKIAESLDACLLTDEELKVHVLPKRQAALTATTDGTTEGTTEGTTDKETPKP